MHRTLVNLAFVMPDSRADHQTAIWAICVVCSLFFVGLLVSTKGFWKPFDATPTKITTDRAEKSCDAVLSVCALLIPATLGLLTWLREKVGVGSYMIPLGFALLYFFVLLIFTAYLRFNFLWQYNTDFAVTSQRNLRFGYWLTTATSGIVLGLILLSIPVVGLGIGWLKVKEAPPQDTTVRVECKCKGADPAPTPVVTPHKPARPHHRGPSCPCTSKN